MKKSFLVVYDYGQGGVWAFLRARSVSEIQAAFPDLQVVDRRPKWMSKKQMEQLRQTMEFDIDRPEGFLEQLAAKRPGGEGSPARSARDG